MNFNPIIVVGSPRSGTSVIARLLQEELKVMMDEGPIFTDSRNSKGYYEDNKLQAINQSMIKRWKLGTNNEQRMDIKWSYEFAMWIHKRAMRYKLWGFKDPAMIGFIHWTFQFLEKPVFIWPIRSDEQIIKSQVKKFNYPKGMAIKGVKAYKKLITKYIENSKYPLLKIGLKKHRPENGLIAELNGFLNGCSKNRKYI